MKKITVMKYLGAVLAMCCVILLVLHMTNVFSYPDKDDGEDSDLGPRKKILLWNGDWSDAYTFGTGHQAFVDAQCPVSVI